MTSSRRLDSWKEISEYLGRDVRTALRWERDRGLPVHRVPGGRRGSVFAVAEEVDAWLLATRASVTDEPGRPRADVTAAPAAVAAPAASRRRGLPIALAVALLLAVAATGLAWRLHAASVAAVPVRAALRSHALVAFDASDRELWSLPFADPVVGWPNGGPPLVTDVDGDGRPEVLASVNVVQSPRSQRGELLCVGATGALRWRRTLDDEVTFRASRVGPPWQSGIVVAYATAQGARIAWSQNNSPSWPAMVLVFDPAGRRVGRFVHSGSIYALEAIDGADGPLLVGGGVVNSQRAAAAFVLDGRNVRGHSVEPPSSPFECLSCEPGEPLASFVFPPNEINRASGAPYNVLAELSRHGAGFHAVTTEQPHETGLPAQEHFYFSRELVLERSFQSDSWPAHEYFHQKGRLDHSVAECPMYKRPPTVLAGDSIRGWRKLAPPVASLADSRTP